MIFAAKTINFYHICQVSFAYVKLKVANHENWQKENWGSDREKKRKTKVICKYNWSGDADLIN